MATQMEKAEALRALHKARRLFVIPNAWDAGSARLLAGMGFSAIATTSAGLAFSRGQTSQRPVGEVMFANAAEIAAATDLPVNGDLEKGLGDSPEAAAETIRWAIDVGLAGGSIEDATWRPDEPIFDIGMAAERIRAAAEAIREQSIPFQLVARAENYVWGRPDLADTIRRLQAYQEAGADVLFAPGLKTADEIRTVLREIDRPLNVVMGLRGCDLTLDDLAELGVTRASVGGAFTRLAYGAVIEAAREILDHGTFSRTQAAIPTREMDAIFTE